MNRFRRNLVKITNIFALLHRLHLHFTQVLNSCSCILPAAGRRPPGGSGELRSPAAVLPHRRACGRPPAPCTTRKKDTAPHRLPRTACPAAAPCAPQEPAAQPCAPAGRTPRGGAAGAGLRPAAAPPLPLHLPSPKPLPQKLPLHLLSPKPKNPPTQKTAPETRSGHICA